MDLSDIEEKDSSNMATGGVSEDDAKLLQAFRLLGLQTKFETPEELLSFAQDLHKTSNIVAWNHILHQHQGMMLQILHTEQRLTIFQNYRYFFGAESKGDVTWPFFKFEVESLEEANTLTSEQIFFGIRRSLKGSAGDKVD